MIFIVQLEIVYGNDTTHPSNESFGREFCICNIPKCQVGKRLEGSYPVDSVSGHNRTEYIYMQPTEARIPWVWFLCHFVIIEVVTIAKGFGNDKREARNSGGFDWIYSSFDGE